MKKSAVNQELLHLLVSLYNQTIQTYHYFPDVIICGRQRLEREDFSFLLANEFLVVTAVDSFGKYYRLSKKGEQNLLHSSFRRRYKLPAHTIPAAQSIIPFC